MLEDFELFDFEESQVQVSYAPPCSSMEFLPSVPRESLLRKEETLIVVTFSPFDKKCAVQIAKNFHLVFIQYVEENFVRDPSGFHLSAVMTPGLGLG